MTTSAQIHANQNNAQGTSATSSGDLLMRLATANFPDQSIGILSAEVAQDNRSTVKVLAYQPAAQSCAVFPDSSEGANDKVNVRNGLYPIWGPLHLFIRLNGSGYPANAKAGEVAGYLAGTRPTPPGVDLILIEAQRHAVPQCASFGCVSREKPRRPTSAPSSPNAPSTNRSIAA